MVEGPAPASRSGVRNEVEYCDSKKCPAGDACGGADAGDRLSQPATCQLSSVEFRCFFINRRHHGRKTILESIEMGMAWSGST